jgi:hypothetical protein
MREGCEGRMREGGKDGEKGWGKGVILIGCSGGGP